MTTVIPPSLEDLIKQKGSIKKVILDLIEHGETDTNISRRFNIPYYIVLMCIKDYHIKSNLKFNNIIECYNKISAMKSVKGKRTELEKYLNLSISYEKKIRFILPRLSDSKYGLGEETILEALRLSANKTKSEMQQLRIDYGEVGDVAYLLTEDKEPNVLLDEIYYTANIIPGLGNYKKVLCLASLFKKCNKEESKYLCRLFRQKLYLGLPTQTIINTVCKYLRVLPELLNQAVLIKGTLEGLLIGQYGNKALEKIKIKPGIFIGPQLCYLFDRKRIRYPCRVDLKYDGSRISVHKVGNNIWIFSRRGILRNNAYPEIVEIANNIKSSSCILDGEIIGIENGKIVPFQRLLERIGKKQYDDITSSDIELTVRFFDVLYHNIPIINYTYEHRLGVLREIIPNIKYLATGKICRNFADIMEYYDKKVSEGHEGIVIKDLTASYYPGRRHYSWLKLKAERDTLDCVITKAKYGSGKLAGWYASFRLAVRDDTKKVLYEIGDCGGLSEETMELLLDKIKPLETSTKDKEGINLIPKLIIEVSFYEIQHSKRYSSGYALRNPKFIRIREDKNISQIDTLSHIQQLYSLQRR